MESPAGLAAGTPLSKRYEDERVKADKAKTLAESLADRPREEALVAQAEEAKAARQQVQALARKPTTNRTSP